MTALDHVSLVGEQRDFAQLGFRVTPTEGSSSHARVFLDGTYFEVTPPDRLRPRPQVGSRSWFLRPEDSSQAAEELRAAGLTVEGPSPYRGEDGEWLDLSLPGRAKSALPIFTKRVDLPEGKWPPPLGSAHPNGAVRLVELHLQVGDPAPLRKLFEALQAPLAAPDTFELEGAARIAVGPSGSGPVGVSAVVVERVDGERLKFVTEPLGL
jgi:hypothetical protein